MANNPDAVYKTSQGYCFDTIYKTFQGYCFDAMDKVYGPYTTHDEALKHLDTYLNSLTNKISLVEAEKTYQFDIGDAVEKIDGDHGYTATIAARFHTKADAERYVVEIPAVRGSFLHIVGPKNLRLLKA